MVFGVVVCGNLFLFDDDDTEWDADVTGLVENADIWDDCLDEVETFSLKLELSGLTTWRNHFQPLFPAARLLVCSNPSFFNSLFWIAAIFILCVLQINWNILYSVFIWLSSIWNHKGQVENRSSSTLIGIELEFKAVCSHYPSHKILSVFKPLWELLI